ncbi:NAD-dependent epimerase/dehydratase family protein [Bergeyella sp. RCAD1439]|uniref:NAD-dependent epimerase/dehydratase family protein n=1 Tax=Bergeyella anatis TaxID=3113737 RepID=UPI002E196D11|nr:NAD-dependent epimerase/dehydratase family protein [Bergeyella sp. RCAD1439]
MVLVTGATGMVGTVVVLELIRRGYRVRAAKRTSSNLEVFRRSLSFYTDRSEEYFRLIDWVDVDFGDAFSLEKALQGVTQVYHCAAKVSFDPGDRKALWQTNWEGTRRLLYACESANLRAFCLVSSIAVLDGVDETGRLTEDSDFNPKLAHSDYAVSKYLAEMEVWRASAEGLRTVIVNPGVVIGSGDWKRSSGTLFDIALRSGYTFPGGTGYVDVRDVARAAVELVEKEAFGERYILVAENLRYETFGRMVRALKGLGEQKVLSEGVLRLAAGVGCFLGWLVPPLRLANRANVDAVTGFVEISNEKIKKRLGFDFIPVEESLAFHFRNYLKKEKQ